MNTGFIRLANFRLGNPSHNTETKKRDSPMENRPKPAAGHAAEPGNMATQPYVWVTVINILAFSTLLVFILCVQ